MGLTSTHWGTYEVEVKDGKVAALTPFSEDPDPSPIGPSIVDILEDKMRIMTPAIRESWLDNGPGAAPEKRGSDRFVSVSWDEAETLVAGELDRVCKTHGNQAIYAGSYGWASAGRFHHAQSQVHRFLNSIGGYTKSKNTYSYAAAEVIIPHVLGGGMMDLLTLQTSWDSVVKNSKLMVAFGGLPVSNSQMSNGGTGAHIQRVGVREAAKAGVRFVNLSPRRSDMKAEIEEDWLQLRPNTDVAVMLGMCHTLLVEDLHDRSFLDRCTTGFDKFEAYLRGSGDGTPKTAAWAADISGMAAEEIITLTRQMAAERTMLTVSWSLTRQQYGEQPFWAVVALAAMIGDIGKPGGGVGFGYTIANYFGNNVFKMPYAPLPQGQNKVADFIPVARISDMLLGPGQPFDYNGQHYTYPDIDLVYWAGGNPFHHHQDLARMRRAWEKPSTVIINDWCWNALARHADIVLPCTTMLERQDLGMTPRDPYVISMDQAVPPVGAARHDYDIFAGIARRMGAEATFTEGRTAEEWQRWIWDESRAAAAKIDVEMPDYESFRKAGFYKSPKLDHDRIFLSEFCADPAASPLATPSGKIELFSQTVASFNYDDCPGHPTWMAPKEWLGAVEGSYPLHLLANQPRTKLHSQMDNGRHSRAAKVNGHEAIEINSHDAAARGLKDGDIVRVFNDRGACLCGVTVTHDVMLGVVVISTGAWYDPLDPTDPDSMCKHGNPNMLSPDIGTSKLGQGPAAHSCLVDVEMYDGPAVTVTAFDPPEIVTRG
ncbi:molybdopterin guanine dinucleotide-containing S/N-oxide reductase [bacterium]|nr:molybdopterin guanine dinucleotide-containing S/N-oxide reductase [bacterium]